MTGWNPFAKPVEPPSKPHATGVPLLAAIDLPLRRGLCSQNWHRRVFSLPSRAKAIGGNCEKFKKIALSFCHPEQVISYGRGVRWRPPM